MITKYWLLIISFFSLTLFSSKQFVAQNINSSLLSIDSEIIKVDFENHVPGTKYNKTEQSNDWDVISSKESWMNMAMITNSEARSGNNSLKITYLPDA